ncbi:Histone H5 [Penicillium roqueforti FM164]|uniref:Histone H1 n=1 Tax=Penicillium roqueforti (strain FM164) TaxID=1365484 RepID=W6QS81_PENRF|nr:Histone H5 [Penicillium roqueforti FM164]
MPPKKVTSASKKVAPALHTSYRDMIKDAIINLKERNGSSRQAIKNVFDSQFNKAIKAGVEKDEFTQPKGPSGPLKLAKKDVPVKAAPKPVAKPVTKAPAKPIVKAAAPKVAPKKATVAKTAAPKKAAVKKTTATKPKANSGKARKATDNAPAIVEQPKILGKTKSGRITKTTAPQPTTTTRAAPKKRTTKK